MSEFNPELLPYVGNDLCVKVNMPYIRYNGDVSMEPAYYNIIAVDNATDTVYFTSIMAWIIDELILNGRTEYYDDIYDALKRIETAPISEFDEFTIYQPLELYTTPELYEILETCEIIGDDDTYYDDEDYFL